MLRQRLFHQLAADFCRTSEDVQELCLVNIDWRCVLTRLWWLLGNYGLIKGHITVTGGCFVPVSDMIEYFILARLSVGMTFVLAPQGVCVKSAHAVLHRRHRKRPAWRPRQRDRCAGSLYPDSQTSQIYTLPATCLRRGVRPREGTCP